MRSVARGSFAGADEADAARPFHECGKRSIALEVANSLDDGTDLPASSSVEERDGLGFLGNRRSSLLSRGASLHISER